MEIEVVQGQTARFILVTKCKARTVYTVSAAHAFGQPAYESCFAAAQITDQFKYFTALKLTADCLCQA